MRDNEGKFYEAAWLYYVAGLTQEQVAHQMGVNKATVSRHISGARASNMVTVTVNSRGLTGLETKLKHTFGLSRAHVIPSLSVPPGYAGPGLGIRRELAEAGDDAAQRAEFTANLQNEELGRAAAKFIGSTLGGGIGVGLGGGRAVAAFAHHLSDDCPRVGMDFYALAVSSREPFATCATSLTAMCTILVNATFKQHVAQTSSRSSSPAPVVEGHALRLPERGSDFQAMGKAAEDYYEMAMQKVRIVIASIGSIETCWVLDDDERKKLAQNKGAVGDILYDIYGEGGTPIEIEPNAAVFPFTINRLQHMVANKAEVIVITSGKTAATYHALVCRDRRFVTGIVTDEKTARSLLDYAAQAKR